MYIVQLLQYIIPISYDSVGPFRHLAKYKLYITLALNYKYFRLCWNKGEGDIILGTDLNTVL